MADIDALHAHLEANYANELAGGHNGTLALLLNEPESASPSKRFDDVAVADFLDAISGLTLTREQEERIRTYTQGRETVALSKDGVRAWVQANLAGAIPALRALAERDTTVAEEAGVCGHGERVSLRDVRAAARLSSASAVSQYEAAEATKTADRIARLEAAGLAEATTRANAQAKADA